MDERNPIVLGARCDAMLNEVEKIDAPGALPK